MRRYTTPTLTLLAQAYDEQTDTYGPIDLTTYRVWVSIEQPHSQLEFADPTMELTEDGTLVTLRLTQEQTARLCIGTAEVQINWMTSDGTRGATDIGRLVIDRNLLGEVREYGA